jgi:hypothetical protein
MGTATQVCRQTLPVWMLFYRAERAKPLTYARLYGTMESSDNTTEGGKSPLVIEGMSPLDVAVKRLGLTIEAFCSEIGINSSTYRRWRSAGVAHLDHVQAKNLDRMLRTVGLSIHDLPDSLVKHPTKKALE